MESVIKLLPEFLANQIAAGEVVQRPESVVKELVENAIDAGANSVAVIVQQSGKTLIHVIDNGKGMSTDDLPLALKRHATSKIATVEDLHKIMTLGFRGEALASIAAVANIEIRTKQKQDSIGYRLVSEPLKSEILEPFQCDKGTQIIVKNLFYNVPARKKFLRSDLTEFRHISETMVKFALAHPTIRFTFSDNKTVIFDVKEQSLSERIRAITGAAIADNLHEIQFEKDGIKISGFAGSPSTAAHMRGNQYLFLNNRSIISRSLSFAISQIYEPYIDKSTYPFYLINITVNPETIDVNVHPQKHEVKFDNERAIFALLQEAVLKALNTAHSIPDLQQHQAIISQPFSTFGERGGIVNRITGEIISSDSSNNARQTNDYRQQSFGNQINNQQVKRPFTSHDLTAYEALFGKNEPAVSTTDSLFREEEQSLDIWQIHNSYIVHQTVSGLHIIDQYNAHLRLLYDEIMEKSDGREISQTLLFAVSLPLTQSELYIIEESEKEIKNLGFQFSIEKNTLILNAVPFSVKSGDEEKSFKELLSFLAEDMSSLELDVKRRIALAFARSNAVQSGNKLSKEEMKAIVHGIERLGKNPMSPNGKPIIISLTLEDLLRTFRT